MQTTAKPYIFYAHLLQQTFFIIIRRYKDIYSKDFTNLYKLTVA